VNRLNTFTVGVAYSKITHAESVLFQTSWATNAKSYQHAAHSWRTPAYGTVNVYTITDTSQVRVASLAFLKPDCEILAFFGNQKKPDKIWLFSVGKAFLWKNIVWAAYSLQSSSQKSLQPCMMHIILKRFYCCPKNDRCYW